MRVSEDVRRIVAFLGVADDTPGLGGIRCLGTGFFLHYDGHGYFVTAKHVAHAVRDTAYLVRINMKDGSSENVQAEGLNWHDHPDPTVDVAIAGCFVPETAGMSMMYLHDKFLVDDEAFEVKAFDVGDMAYAVGLFRVLSGEKRNLPVVHAGNIALVPGDEKIPVRGWLDPNKTIQVEGFLVQTSGLDGLSGSPVFVRSSWDIDVSFKVDGQENFDTSIRAPSSQMYLLGVWQGSWDAPPDEVMAMEVGRGMRVPVGFGVVVPAQKIVEVLELPKVKQERENFKKENADELGDAIAKPDVAPVSKKSASNPNHRADFDRLLGAAVKSKK